MSFTSFIAPQESIRVSGEDALEWLNGQLTADIRQAAAPTSNEQGRSVYALLLSPQGKILTDVWVYKQSDSEFILSLPKLEPSLRASIMEHLDRYIVMEDVELTEDETVFQSHSKASDSTSQWLSARLGKTFDSVVAQDLDTGLSERERESLRVAKGIPRFGIDFGNDTLPQEAGLRHAISFDKGCYVGQEPVIMLEHRGKPRQRLVKLVADQTIPEAAELLLNGVTVGRITSHTMHEGKAIALGLVRRKSLDACPKGPFQDASGVSYQVESILGNPT